MPVYALELGKSMQLTLELNGPLIPTASVVAPPHSSFGGGLDDNVTKVGGRVF